MAFCVTAVLLPRQQAKLARGAKDEEHAMSQTANTAIAVIGIDIGKNSFHVVGNRSTSLSGTCVARIARRSGAMRTRGAI